MTGVRFYKGAQNTGTPHRELWSASGTLLASATFTSSPPRVAAGDFSTPVAVTAGTTYIASYQHQQRQLLRHHRAVQRRLGGQRAPARAGRGPHGGQRRVRLRVDAAFPNETWNRQQLLGRHGLLARHRHHPADGAVDLARQRRHRRPSLDHRLADMNEQLQTGTATVSLTSSGGSRGRRRGLRPLDQQVTLHPGAALAAGTLHTATVSGAKDVTCRQPRCRPVHLDFTTAAAAVVSVHALRLRRPGGARLTSRRPVELGVQFTPAPRLVRDRGAVLQGRPATPAPTPAACGPRRGP